MLSNEEFARMADPFRAELLAHCYRMLGSVSDAEDQVQETLIRAWRGYGQFEGRSSLRTWLYRIATNVCLRALENRARRPLPSGLGAPSADADRLPAAARAEVPWLEPFPDLLHSAYQTGAYQTGSYPIGAGPADPAAIVEARASTRLALVAALQYLPARQRAVLILRDVLRWRAAEVAELLGTTTTAVNSALQRARERLELQAPAADEVREPAGAAVRALLDQYAAAIENADVTALARLLQEEAVLEMPPQPDWFAGRDRVLAFLGGRVLAPGKFRMVPVGANGQPGFALYLRGPSGVYRAHGIQVLTVGAAGITRIVSFNSPALLARFGQPDVLVPAPAGPR